VTTANQGTTEHAQNQPGDTGDQGQQLQQQPETTIADADDLAFQEAVKVADAEDAAATGEGDKTEKPGETAQGQQQQAKPGEPQQQQPEQVTIPKARFDEVNTAKSRAETEAAYWRGVAEGRQAPPAPGASGQQGQQQEPTTEQKLGEVDAKVDALAKRFDDGEITMAEFKREERKLQGERAAIEDAAKPKPAETPANGQGDPLYLETLTAQLEKDHPWLGVYEQVGTDAHWGFLRQQAVDNLLARRIDPTRTDTVTRYELRKEIATLATEYGPGMLTKAATAKGITLPGQQAPANGQQQQQQPTTPALSRDAKDRLKKLELAKTTPPNINHIGTTQTAPAGGPTDEDAAAFSEDDYDKLPAAVRSKLLGITA
jgi:hypothetical protein